MISLKQNINLSHYTTIKLGGPAKYFIECNTINDIIETLKYANGKNFRLQVLGGGSNIIFSDEGFDGIVIKINLKGITIQNNRITVAAGENWDNFVNYTVENNFTGIESLSGIPGTVGATPIQNVGAYGREVSNTIQYVKALDKTILEVIEFNNNDCKFAYRQSRFKNEDKDKYIITEVTFVLERDKEPEIKYEELKKYIDGNTNYNNLKTNTEKLRTIRKAVLNIRKKKSMITDENDSDSVSCGSFFLNPILNQEEYNKFVERFALILGNPEVSELLPIIHKTPAGYKIPAACLIENAGFHKGYEKNNVGISSKHSLALINKGGTTKALLELSKEIEKKVYDKFAVRLHPEPVIIQ